MDILALGDTHGDLEFTIGAIDLCQEYGIDRIVQVGDFGFVWPGLDSLNELDSLNDYASSKNIRIYVVPGNHEDWDQLDYIESTSEKDHDGFYKIRDNIWYAGRVNRWSWDGISYASVGGAYSIDKFYRVPGDSWWPQEMLTDSDIEKIKSLDIVDVLFTHDSPTNIPLKLFNSNESHLHRSYMNIVGEHLKPKVWIHGHYHTYLKYKFDNSSVYGLSYNYGADPTHVILNGRDVIENYRSILGG